MFCGAAAGCGGATVRAGRVIIIAAATTIPTITTAARIQGRRDFFSSSILLLTASVGSGIAAEPRPSGRGYSAWVKAPSNAAENSEADANRSEGDLENTRSN